VDGGRRDLFTPVSITLSSFHRDDQRIYLAPTTLDALLYAAAPCGSFLPVAFCKKARRSKDVRA